MSNVAEGFRKPPLVTLLIPIFLVSGCAGANVESDIYINRHSEIDRVEIAVEMDTSDVDMDEDLYEDETGGFDPYVFEENPEALEESLRESFPEDLGGFSSTDVRVHGPESFTFILYDLKLSESSQLKTSGEEEHIVYREEKPFLAHLFSYVFSPKYVYVEDGEVQREETTDRGFEMLREAVEDEGSLKISSKIHMPGPILETNGELVGEDTVRYDASEIIGLKNRDEYIYVKSKGRAGIFSRFLNWIKSLFTFV